MPIRQAIFEPSACNFSEYQALMTEDLAQFVHRIFESPFWEHFRLIPAQVPTSGSIFSFSEYLAALALLLVVMVASDFRSRYRLSLARTDLRKVGFWVGLCVGVAILTTDVWFQNGLPIPQLMANPNNLKAALGIVFLGFVFCAIWVAVIRPPVFKKANAKRFFDANYHFIHEGNADQLQVIAEELRRPLPALISSATKLSVLRDGTNMGRISPEAAHAYDLLLLIADRRFCRIVVEKVPAFALILLQEVGDLPTKGLPILPFVRNIGQEFIRNKESSLYQEQSGYFSGLFGLERPVTKLLFGSYDFVEVCARRGGSPFDIEYAVFSEFDEDQISCFRRAAGAFLESYLTATGGTHHSSALMSILRSFETSIHRAYEMDGLENYRRTAAYSHLGATVEFIKDTISLVEERAEKPLLLRTRRTNSWNLFDQLARFVFEAIFSASGVSAPVWTAWGIQNNTVWSPIFDSGTTATHRIIAFKLRRMIYDEIKRMDRFANFKGARLLGFCLNVLGLKLTDRHRGFRREFYPLQALGIRWVKANYRVLLAEHPEVAEACLQGQISYDRDNHRLVQTYSDRTGKEPSREFLYLD